MLYKSLQQTIHEYEKRKKQTQNQGERRMFKWKVFALSFCIIAILLIGILSQLIKFEEENQLETHNFTFIPTLLQHSQQLDQINSIKSLLYGLNKSPRIIFDKSQLLLSKSQIYSQQLIESIKGKRNILYLINLKEQINPDEPPLIYRFGILLKNQYDSEIDPEDNLINVFDNIEDLSSVFFNLDNNQAIRLNLNPGCRIYSFNETSKIIRLIQTVQLANNQEESNKNKIHFEVTKNQCFGPDEALALKQIEKITGIELTSSKQVKQLQIELIEVFYLTFNGENIQ